MKGGGSIQAMVTSMKNNAGKRKPVDTAMAGIISGSLYKDSTTQNNHTPEQIEATKAAFKQKAAAENRRRWNWLIATILITPVICYALFRFIGYLIN